MDEYDINRNGSGYYDPTAFQAMKKCIRMEKKEMEFYEGDIVEIEMNNGGTREAVILSVHSRFSTILILKDDESLPYSVNCKGVKYTDPGMLGYAFNSNIKELIRSMKKDEMCDLMQEVVDALGYAAPVKEVTHKTIEEKPEETGDSSEIAAKMAIELAKASAERDVYKQLYDNLISSMISK